jgi:hypothetical protein
MPRKACLDGEGTLHHVMARGIERGSIFKDDEDPFLPMRGFWARVTS